jgi:adenine-specific DNA-methyltransferase
MNQVPKPESTETTPMLESNLASLLKLFPGVFNDGVLDAKRLGESLGVQVATQKEGTEGFGLVWSGKKEAIFALQATSYAALEPKQGESINWDTARNIFIEGDNLELLKLLQTAYNDRAKLVYLDPPYNTANDLVYKDDFSDELAHYLQVTGQVDSDGNKLLASIESSGRKHSGWLTMMYPRLFLARNLLRQDGILAISIDTIEFANLKSLVIDIFGEENYIGEIIWTYSHGENAADISKNHEYLLMVARDAQEFPGFRLTQKELFELGAEISDACFRAPQPKNPLSLLEVPAGVRSQKSGSFTIPKGEVHFGVSYCEFMSDAHFVEGILQNPVQIRAAWTMKTQCSDWFKGMADSSSPKVLDSKGQTVLEIFFGNTGRLSYRKERSASSKVSSHWSGTELTYSRARADLEALFEKGNPFSYPKPVALLQRIVELTTESDDLILDLFAGSATTGEAVLRQNILDGSNRQFLLATIDEPVASNSKAKAMGFETIPEIARERLDRVYKQSGITDGEGLKVFKLGPSNFERRPQSPDEELEFFISTKSENFSEYSAVIEILLSLGVPLGESINIQKVDKTRFYNVGNKMIVAGSLDSLSLRDLAKEQGISMLCVFEDDLQGKDSLKSNLFFEAKKLNIVFKTY